MLRRTVHFLSTVCLKYLVFAVAACLAERPLASALRAYQRRRWLALRYYQTATRWLTPWFQSDHEWLTPVRRLFFSISRKLRPARKFMTRTMAGLVGAR